MRKVALLDHSRYRRATAAYHEIGISPKLPLIGKLLHSGRKLKQHAVTAKCQLAITLTQMGNQGGVEARDIHSSCWPENRIISRFADLAHIEAVKDREARRKTIHGPRSQPSGTYRHHAGNNNLRATVTMRAKADRILDETVGRPSQQETDHH